MTKITRYVISELLKVFLVTLAGMTVLMLIAGVAQEAIRQGLGPQPIVRLIPYAIPNALRFAVPGTILFAACLVFGRLASSNEITALKALGISPVRVVVPALALAFLVSLLAVWLNDLAVSWGRQGMRSVLHRSAEQIVYGILRTQGSYSTRRFSIKVKRVEGRRLILPTICIHPSDRSTPTVVTADWAELRLNLEKNVLIIALTNAKGSIGDDVKLDFPDNFEYEIPLSEATRIDEGSDHPWNGPLWRIAQDLEQQQATILRMRQEFAAEVAFQLTCGEIASLTEDPWTARHQRVQEAVARLRRLETEPWRRWANGFSCLFFVMVGAPLALRLRNADIWSSFGLCFLPILIVYYPLLVFGVDQAKSGELPPYAVWLGNVILAIAGVWLMRKVVRY